MAKNQSVPVLVYLQVSVKDSEQKEPVRVQLNPSLVTQEKGQGEVLKQFIDNAISSKVNIKGKTSYEYTDLVFNVFQPVDPQSLCVMLHQEFGSEEAQNNIEMKCYTISTKRGSVRVKELPLQCVIFSNLSSPRPKKDPKSTSKGLVQVIYDEYFDVRQIEKKHVKYFVFNLHVAKVMLDMWLITEDLSSSRKAGLDYYVLAIKTNIRCNPNYIRGLFPRISHLLARLHRRCVEADVPELKDLDKIRFTNKSIKKEDKAESYSFKENIVKILEQLAKYANNYNNRVRTLLNKSEDSSKLASVSDPDINADDLVRASQEVNEESRKLQIEQSKDIKKQTQIAKKYDNILMDCLIENTEFDMISYEGRNISRVDADQLGILVPQSLSQYQVDQKVALWCRDVWMRKDWGFVIAQEGLSHDEINFNSNRKQSRKLTEQEQEKLEKKKKNKHKKHKKKSKSESPSESSTISSSASDESSMDDPLEQKQDPSSQQHKKKGGQARQNSSRLSAQNSKSKKSGKDSSASSETTDSQSESTEDSDSEQSDSMDSQNDDKKKDPSYNPSIKPQPQQEGNQLDALNKEIAQKQKVLEEQNQKIAHTIVKGVQVKQEQDQVKDQKSKKNLQKQPQQEPQDKKVVTTQEFDEDDLPIMNQFLKSNNVQTQNKFIKSAKDLAGSMIQESNQQQKRKADQVGSDDLEQHSPKKKRVSGSKQQSLSDKDKSSKKDKKHKKDKHKAEKDEKHSKKLEGQHQTHQVPETFPDTRTQVSLKQQQQVSQNQRDTRDNSKQEKPKEIHNEISSKGKEQVKQLNGQSENDARKQQAIIEQSTKQQTPEQESTKQVNTQSQQNGTQVDIATNANPTSV